MTLLKNSSRKLIRADEVRRRCGNPSRVTIWRWIRDGRFPQPVKLGENSIAWFEDEVDDHQANLPRVNYAAATATPSRR